MTLLNRKYNEKLVSLSEIKTQEAESGKYANAPYFLEKDRKAKEFLLKHPIPEKFLKED